MNRILEAKLAEYDSPPTHEARAFAIREIVQEIVLYSLSVNGFFQTGVFHGGTELRLVHGLPRFSEDLDFILSAPDNSFTWDRFADALRGTCATFGMKVELRTSASTASSIRKLILVDADILGRAPAGRTPSLRISLELDVDPPQGAGIDSAFLDFPIPFEIAVMNLPSSFALKCHALLCRSWVKGRDWFDFLWFSSRAIRPRMDLLASSLHQSGPWKNQKIRITQEWLHEELARKIRSIDWHETTRDVAPFLSQETRGSLGSWREEFFLHYLAKMHVADR